METKLFIAVLLAGIISCGSPADKQKDKEQQSVETTTQNEAESPQFSKIIKMECIEKSHQQSGGTAVIHYKFTINNLTEKDINSFKGRIVFSNKEGIEVKSFTMAYDQLLEAGEEVIWEAETLFDEFMDDENALRSADVKDLTCKWEPIEVSYANGKTVTDFNPN